MPKLTCLVFYMMCPRSSDQGIHHLLLRFILLVRCSCALLLSNRRPRRSHKYLSIAQLLTCECFLAFAPPPHHAALPLYDRGLASTALQADMLACSLQSMMPLVLSLFYYFFSVLLATSGPHHAFQLPSQNSMLSKHIHPLRLFLLIFCLLSQEAQYQTEVTS